MCELNVSVLVTGIVSCGTAATVDPVGLTVGAMTVGTAVTSGEQLLMWSFSDTFD